MSRWGLSSFIWSGLASQAARDRLSYRVCSTNTCLPRYEPTPPVSYRLKSRVSVYDSTSTSRYPPSSRDDYSRYDNYRPRERLRAEGHRPVYPRYSTSGGSFGSSSRQYETTDRFYRSDAAPPTRYYRPVGDAYYDEPRRRSSTSRSRHGKTETPKKKKTVHWDDETYNNDGHDWHKRYDRHDGYDYGYSYDRHGQPVGMRGASPRATASGDSYYYTAAARPAPLARDDYYYHDEVDRRSSKHHHHKSRSSRHSR